MRIDLIRGRNALQVCGTWWCSPPAHPSNPAKNCQVIQLCVYVRAGALGFLGTRLQQPCGPRNFGFICVEPWSCWSRGKWQVQQELSL
jgi:hypothetical protein